MREYVCSVCGYVHKGELPDDFVCPICGAGRDAFVLKEDPSSKTQTEKPHFEKELSAAEMSVICSNLARSCEKQYMPEESEAFKALAEFFNSKDGRAVEGGADKIAKLVEKDLSVAYPYANETANEFADRGAKRALVWSEKVTRMLQSILTRYKSEGESMLENTGVYVCTVCGFIYIGDRPPELCPVCKVPSWKFEKAERRA